MKYKLLLSIIIFLSCLNIRCTHKDSYVKTEGMIWNTIYHVTYKGNNNLQDSILPVLNEVGKSLSVFDKNSLVSFLNISDSVKADIHLSCVYDESLKINHLSKGLFDPTVSPLVDAWGFGIGHSPTTDTLALDSVLTFVGIQKTHHKGEFIYKDDPRIRFNFSAIAKGYGCDAVGEMFKRNGVFDYMVEIGGEVCLRGESPSGELWKIAIDAPKEGGLPGEETVIVLTLSNVGIATSGNYRNFRIDGDRKVAHTISPVTGKPVSSEILSSTVIAPTCMEADAIATACMASDVEEAKSLLKKAQVEGMLIFSDSIWMSNGFRNFVGSLSQ